MFRQLFKAMVVARQAWATAHAMQYMSVSQLNDLGYDRSTYVDSIKSMVMAELDAQDHVLENMDPVNVRLVGAV